MKKRLLGAILALALLSALATTGALADSETTGGLTYEGTASYDEATGVLTITGDTTVSGTTTSDTIVIKGGTVTLDGVNISNNAAAQISVGGTATITLAAGSTNTLTGNLFAALHVAPDASLTINGSGTLNANSKSGAGIGGNVYFLMGDRRSLPALMRTPAAALP